MSGCQHELWEREEACADGYCPLCQAIDLRNLRAAVQPTEPKIAGHLVVDVEAYVDLQVKAALAEERAAHPPVQPTEPRTAQETLDEIRRQDYARRGVQPTEPE